MKTFALLITGLLLAGSASAQAVKPNTGFYIGADIGAANGVGVNSRPGDRTTSENKTTGAAGMLAGYQFTPNWALEGSVFSTGEFNRRGTNGLASYDAKSVAGGYSLAGVYKFTEIVPGFFVKAGLTYGGVERTRTTRVGGLSSSIKSEQSGAGYMFGLGYEYDFTPNWSGQVAYTRLQRLGGVQGANADLITVGVRYRF